MSNHGRFYMHEQVEEAGKDAESLCQLMMQKVPESKRQVFSASVLAYMNGFEAGIAAGRDGYRETG